MKSLEDVGKVPDGGVETVSGECDQHGAFTREALWIFGELKNENPACPACVQIEEAEKQKQAQDELSQRRIAVRERKLAEAGIPVRILEASKFVPPTSRAQKNLEAIHQYLKDFDEHLRNGASLVLCGKPGTGKTHLASKMGAALVERGYSVQYVTLNKALRRIRSTYAKDSEFTEAGVIASLTTPDLLILDELGVKLASDFDKSMMFEVIDERYQSKKPTIVISNLSVDGLREATDERMVDRLQHNGTVLIFDWGSYRKQPLEAHA